MASFGETLKRERELREISLREISDATKINIRYLEALEQNRFESLPGGLFNKGFIRAYATYIGVDSESMVNSYLQEITARVAGSGPIEAHSAVHRPAEVVRRRTAARGDSEPREMRAPAITFAPAAPPIEMGGAGGLSGVPGSPSQSGETQPTSPGAPAAAIAAPPVVPAAPPAKDPAIVALAAALAHRAARPRAVSGIEEARVGPAESRSLLIIVSLVAGAGLLFLLLSLLLGHKTPEPSGSGAGSAVADGSLAEPGPGPGEPPAFAEPSGTGGEHASGGLAIASSGPAGGAAPDGRKTGTASIASEPRATKPRPIRGPGFDAPDIPDAEADDAAATPPAAAGGAGMDLRLKATDRTWVQLFCDSHEVVNWVMPDGEAQTARCLNEIRISAADAAAVRLWINGQVCAPLGERGARVLGYAIRIDDYRQICPPSGRGHDARN